MQRAALDVEAISEEALMECLETMDDDFVDLAANCAGKSVDCSNTIEEVFNSWLQFLRFASRIDI